MYWRAIFISGSCVLLMLVIGYIGLRFYHEMPWVSGLAAVADFGLIFGGVKATLETIKLTGELQKTSLELRKLRLEIASQEVAAKEREARITVPDFEQIEKFGRPMDTHVRRRRSSAAAVIAVVLLCVSVATTIDIKRRGPNEVRVVLVQTRGLDKVYVPHGMRILLQLDGADLGTSRVEVEIENIDGKRIYRREAVVKEGTIEVSVPAIQVEGDYIVRVYDDRESSSPVREFAFRVN